MAKRMSSDMSRILISSAGRRVELINCFRKAAEELDTNIEIVAVDMEPKWSPACQIADFFYKVPICSSTEYLDRMLEISKKHDVNLIIPTIDTELLVYSENMELFRKNGIEVLVASTEFIRMARNKEATCNLLKKYNISTPDTWGLKKAFELAEKFKYPLIAKPIDGSCSVGIFVLNSANELKKMNGGEDSYIVQELYRGNEYTVNCFFDNGCVACVPHYRKHVRAGEVCFAETVRIPGFREIADRIADIFPDLYGVLCFQGFKTENGDVNLFEINARFGGGYPICDKSGGTFAKWILQKISGIKPDYNDDWHEGVRMLRYDAAVFV